MTSLISLFHSVPSPFAKMCLMGEHGGSYRSPCSREHRNLFHFSLFFSSILNKKEVQFNYQKFSSIPLRAEVLRQQKIAYPYDESEAVSYSYFHVCFLVLAQNSSAEQ